ncbi:MAG: hypothetical protein U1E16_04630 [Hyphomicrobiales bacterium]
MFFAPPEQDLQFQRLMGFQKACRRSPWRRPGAVSPISRKAMLPGAVLDEHTADIDVDALHSIT